MAAPTTAPAAGARRRNPIGSFLLVLTLCLFDHVESWIFDRIVPRPSKQHHVRLDEDDAVGTKQQPTLSRRTMLQTGVASVTFAGSIIANPTQAQAAADIKDIRQRLQDTILKQAPVQAGGRSRGTDHTLFPDFLEGNWQVTQTLTDVKTPLGLAYIGGPNGLESIAAVSLQESRKQIGVPVQLQLAYPKLATGGVAEDRVYNNASRLNAYAGKVVVAGVEYADNAGSNRAGVLAAGGSTKDPLQTSIVRFKGPAAQKIFVTSYGSETIDDQHWVGYEGQRSIFALTNQSTAPPVFTDSEAIWELERLSPEHVRGRFRIAGYLNAGTDKLYFDAKNRAVSLQEYTLDMYRIKDS